MIETAAVQHGRKFYHHVSVPLDMVGDEQARWSKLVMHQLPRLSDEGAWVVIEHLHLVENWHQKLQSLLQVSSCTACILFLSGQCIPYLYTYTCTLPHVNCIPACMFIRT